MAETLFAVTRKVPRFSFVAGAELTVLRNGSRLLAHVSELSSNGCYIDTPEGFPLGIQVHLSIQYGGSKCDLVGRAIYQHNGWGMGIVFENVGTQQRFIIDGWLAELARKRSDPP